MNKYMAEINIQYNNGINATYTIKGRTLDNVKNKTFKQIDKILKKDNSDMYIHYCISDLFTEEYIDSDELYIENGEVIY